MTSIKVKFRRSSGPDGDGCIYYQLIHDRKVRRIMTQFRIRESECLSGLRRQIGHDVDMLSRIISGFDMRQSDFEVDDVVAEYGRLKDRCSLTAHMQHLIESALGAGRVRMSEIYRSTLRSFLAFTGGEDMMIYALDSSVVERYEAYLQGRGNTPNTISFYMRVLRSVYNRAVDDGAASQTRPFRHVYTGIGKTVKRALPIEVIRQIKELRLERPQACYARDMFMLSFYLRGMSFIDMAFLRKDDLHDGRLRYRRRKTGQLLEIEWTNEMQEIVSRYPVNENGYLLPILTGRRGDERSAYRNVLARINRHLKLMMPVAGLGSPVTLYCARHSWASAALLKGVPVSVISRGMGHDSERTTHIYLSSLDSSVVDRANRLIIESL